MSSIPPKRVDDPASFVKIYTTIFTVNSNACKSAHACLQTFVRDYQLVVHDLFDKVVNNLFLLINLVPEVLVCAQYRKDLSNQVNSQTTVHMWEQL